MKNHGTLCRIKISTLAVLLTSSLLSGCGISPSPSQSSSAASKSAENASSQVVEEGSESPSGGSQVSEAPITFTALYADNSDYPYRKDWVTLQEMTRLTNVTLDAQVVPDSDYTTKQQLIFNSGSIPDIVMKTSPSPDYALNGLFLPIGDYLEQMPNMKSAIETHIPVEWENYRMIDGKIYTIPGKICDKKMQNQTWFLRKDLLDKAGLPVPTTMDEFYEACRAVKEQNPEVTPVANRFGPGNILGMISPSFETRAGWGLPDHGFIYDKASDSWKFAPTSSEYKSLLETMRRFMEEGLLDPEFNTLDSDIFAQRWASGTIFAATDWPDTALQCETEGRVNNPDFEIIATLPFAGPTGVAQYSPVPKSTTSWVVPASVKEDDDFDTLLRFIDWFYTDTAANLFTWGVEGVTYSVVDGKRVYNDDIQTALNPSGTVNAMREYGVNNNCLSVLQAFEWRKDYILGEANGALQDEMNAKGCLPDPYPTLHIPEDQLEDVTLYSKALKDYYDSMTERFIYGKESFDNWEQFDAQCGEKGRDKLDVIINEAWKAQKQ